MDKNDITGNTLALIQKIEDRVRGNVSNEIIWESKLMEAALFLGLTYDEVEDALNEDTMLVIYAP